MSLTPQEQSVIKESDALYAAALKKLRFATPGTPAYTEASRRAKELGDHLHQLKDQLLFGRNDAVISPDVITELKATRQGIEKATQIEETIRGVNQAIGQVLKVLATVRAVV